MTARASSPDARDLEEALSLDTLVWPYDPATCRILAGSYRGARVVDVEAFHARRLAERYGDVHALTVYLRPWWRLWRLTPARVLRPLPRGAEHSGAVRERSVLPSLSGRE